MLISPPPPVGARLMAWLPFVLSAVVAAIAVRIAVREPWTAVLFGLMALLFVTPGQVARRRVRQILRSGDVRAVLGAWSEHFDRLPYPETMRPLISAAAFASCGWIEEARSALDRSVKGPAWDAALEHRLFIETLLDTFEGDRDGALQKAGQLGALPLPAVGPWMQARVRVLRDALSAFARAFAHVSRQGDLELLERAADRSPLMHWALRYAAAIIAVEQREPRRARRLLAGAPAWGDGCAFREFHLELAGALGDLEGAQSSRPAPRS